jgi:hypothetical protein
MHDAPVRASAILEGLKLPFTMRPFILGPTGPSNDQNASIQLLEPPLVKDGLLSRPLEFEPDGVQFISVERPR